MEDTNQYPEDLTALNAEDLAAAEKKARDEAKDLRKIKPEDLTDAQIERMEQIADFLDAMKAEGTRREQATAERTDRAAKAAERIEPPVAEDTEQDPEADPADPESETPDETPAEDPAPETNPEDQTVNPDDVVAPTAVAASAARRAPSSVRRMQQPDNPTPARAETGVLAITAAADITLDGGLGQVNAGAQLGNIAGAVDAFKGRLGHFPQIAQKGHYDRKPVALIHRSEESYGGLHVDNPDYGGDTFKVAKDAADERRLPGGSLIASKMAQQKALVASGGPTSMVAAGGWCAPSENLYGMCADETLDGILDLPTMGVGRGGINYTPGPDFQDIYTSAGFAQTEAEAIAGDTKNCTEVDCPDFTEVRLDAVGVCVKSPLLTKAAYPELVARFLEGSVIANQHKVNARIIAAMRTALGTALAPTLTGTPVTWSTLTAIEWVIEMQRQAYRLSEGESLEVIAPRWLRVAIRADLANRMGIGKESVSNADIAQHFADRGAAIQWVLGYLEVANPTTSVAIPATVEVMVYKAGTFVKGTANVISLDAVYDAADLVTNVYTAAFVEDGVLLAKMCNGGKRITLPVNVTGMLGAATLNDNWGTAQS